MDHWIHQLAGNQKETNGNPYALELILTTLWCIWTHRNQVLFEGKLPNPIETMLTAKSLFNRYMQPNDDNQQPADQLLSTIKNQWQPDNNWEILITTEGGGTKKGRWKGIAYFGKNRSGQTLLTGCKSTRLKDNKSAKVTAVQEAVLKAVSLGFTNIIILVGSKELEFLWYNKNRVN